MGRHKKNGITIITFCSLNYQECLDKFLPSWSADEIIVFTDSDELVVPDTVRKVVLNTYQSTDWHTNTERKILSIQGGLIRATYDKVIWLDVDCLMRDEIKEVFDAVNTDIITTRMVYRRDKQGEKEINSGVIFFRRSQKVIDMIDEWLILARQYFNNPNYCKYHEQTAFSHICYGAYDGLKDFTVGNVSERIYNLEHDDPVVLKEWVNKYNPKIIHFKAGLWRNNNIFK